MINSFIQKLSKILHIIMHFDRNGKRSEKHILIFFNYSKNKKSPVGKISAVFLTIWKIEKIKNHAWMIKQRFAVKAQDHFHVGNLKKKLILLHPLQLRIFKN